MGQPQGDPPRQVPDRDLRFRLRVGQGSVAARHLRALLLERGIIAPKGRKQLEAKLAAFADEVDPRLSPRIRLLVGTSNRMAQS